VGLAVVKASTPGEIEAGFASLAEQRIGALLVDADAFLYVQRDQLAALAVRHAIPAIYALREYAEAGGLMSFGASLREAWRLGGTYVGRVLKGEKPGNLPVQQPARMEMVLNLKAARALGLELPIGLHALADDVIAQLGPSAVSAIRSLSGAKRTLANDIRTAHRLREPKRSHTAQQRDHSLTIGNSVTESARMKFRFTR
jgi:hypothetical protein